MLEFEGCLEGCGVGREVQPSRCQIWERREFYPGKTIFMGVINSGSARSKPIRISPRRTSRAGFAGAVHCLVTKVNVAVQNWVECTYDSIQFDLGKRYSRRQSLPMIFPTPFLFSSHLSGGLTTAIHMPSPRLKRGGYVHALRLMPRNTRIHLPFWCIPSGEITSTCRYIRGQGNHCHTSLLSTETLDFKSAWKCQQERPPINPQSSGENGFVSAPFFYELRSLGPIPFFNQSDPVIWIM